jgi:hypothetical protein
MTVPLANSTTGLGGNETFVATGGNEEDEGEDCDVEGQGDDDDDLPDCDADEEVRLFLLFRLCTFSAHTYEILPTHPFTSNQIETASTSEKRWDWRSAYNRWRSTHSAQVPASTVAQPVSTSAQAPSPTVIAAPVVTSSAAPAPASASSAAAVNTPPPSTGGTSAEDIAAYLKAHNDFRAQVCPAVFITTSCLVLKLTSLGPFAAKVQRRATRLERDPRDLRQELEQRMRLEALRRQVRRE